MKKIELFYQIKSLEIAVLRILTEDNKEDNILKPTPTQMKIIGYIIDNEDHDVFQKDLEKLLGLRRSTVSGILRTMEKYNYIEKSTNVNDARVKKVTLTNQTKNIFLERKKKLLELEKNLTKNINKDELEVFYSVINKMKNNIYLIEKEKED